MMLALSVESSRELFIIRIIIITVCPCSLLVFELVAYCKLVSQNPLHFRAPRPKETLKEEDDEKILRFGELQQAFISQKTLIKLGQLLTSTLR